MTLSTDVKKPNYPKRRFILGLSSLPIFFIVGLFVITPVISNSDNNILIVLIATLLAEIITVGICSFFAWPKGERLKGLKLTKFSLKLFMLGLGIGALMLLTLQFLAIIMSMAGYPLTSSDTSKSLSDTTGVARIFAYYLLPATIVPFVEELFFRGFVLNSLLESNVRRNIVPASILISSAYFALLHAQGISTMMDFIVPLWIFAGAIVNAIFMIKYKSLWVSIGSHVAYNGLTVLLALLLS